MAIPVGEELLWLLEAIKPSYGLGDGPLGWQICLLDFCEDTGGTISHFDENFVIWFAETMMRNGHGIRGLGSAHVDDNNMASDMEWLTDMHGQFVRKFVNAP